jgi:hypothetical protein
MPRKTYDTVAKQRLSRWKDAVHDLRMAGEGDSETDNRIAMLETWRRDPWAYKTALDLPAECPSWLKNCPLIASDGAPHRHPILWTADELDDEVTIKPYPAHWAYLRDLTASRWAYRLWFCDKARQMFVTTDCCLDIDWFSSFNDERETFISRVKEGSAIKMLQDKIRDVHKRKPKWLQAAIPMAMQPQEMIRYTSTNSTVTGVSQNFATSDARGPTASLILVDEAGFQDYFKQIYDAIMPMAGRLWAVTTANFGNPGGDFFRELIREGRAEYAEQQVEEEAA